MKKLLICLSLLSCSAALGLLPEDEARLKQLKRDLKDCEEQVERLQSEIAEKREKIALESSAMVVREAEVRNVPEAAKRVSSELPLND